MIGDNDPSRMELKEQEARYSEVVIAHYSKKSPGPKPRVDNFAQNTNNWRKKEKRLSGCPWGKCNYLESQK